MSRSGGTQQLDSTVPKILAEISVFTAVFPCLPVEKNEMGKKWLNSPVTHKLKPCSEREQ